jgi:diaminopimelate epimerase
MHRGHAQHTVDVRTRGGDLRVAARANGSGGFQEVLLSGPVNEVYTGTIHIGAA